MQSLEGKPSEKKHTPAKRTCFLWWPEVTTPLVLTISLSVVFTTRLPPLPAPPACQPAYSFAPVPTRIISTGRLSLWVQCVKVSIMENTAYQCTCSECHSWNVELLLLNNGLLFICTLYPANKHSTHPLQVVGLYPVHKLRYKVCLKETAGFSPLLCPLVYSCLDSGE